MRIRSTLLAGVTAGATVAGVLGLAASAQAQTAAPNRAASPMAAATTAKSVPAGVVTGVTLNCPSGSKFSSFTSSPAQPSTVTDIATTNGLRLAGVWGTSGSPPKTVGPFTVKVKCTGGKTATFKITNESAPVPTDITGVGSDTILAAEGTPGHIVESGPTDQIFEAPADPRTADYVHGQFG